MKTRDIKTIDVITKTWFDKVNGNTYFAQHITINSGKRNAIILLNNFQYGYSSFDYFAKKFVSEKLNLKSDLADSYDLCSSRGKIKFNNIIIRNCKKRELLNIQNIEL